MREGWVPSPEIKRNGPPKLKDNTFQQAPPYERVQGKDRICEPTPKSIQEPQMMLKMIYLV